MAKMKHVLNVQERTAQGSANARRLRQQGMIPAVIYSKGQAGKNISVHAGEWESLQNFELNLISLEENGKDTLALIQEVQHDFIHNRAMHIDFLEVDRSQKITTHVALHAGHDAPAGVAVGGILNQVIHEVEVECLPDNLPEAIVCDISALQIGEMFHVSQIVAPEGVKVVSHGDLVAFEVEDPSKEPDVPETAAAPAEGDAAAEPEVVGAKEKAEKAAEKAAAAGDKKK